MADAQPFLLNRLLKTALVVCPLLAIGLIGYGCFLVPAASKLSVVATSLVLVGYSVVGWYGCRRSGRKENIVFATILVLGSISALVFSGEVILEYLILPRDNTQMGVVEFGLAFLLYAMAGAVVTRRGCGLRAGVMAAAATAMVSSILWFIVVLMMFYMNFGTAKQQLVFRAEGNYDDFVRSGMADFNAWIMEDFLGAGFFHLLLGPLIAMVLGVCGGIAGLGFRLNHRPRA